MMAKMNAMMMTTHTTQMIQMVIVQSFCSLNWPVRVEVLIYFFVTLTFPSRNMQLKTIHFLIILKNCQRMRMMVAMTKILLETGKVLVQSMKRKK